MACEPTAWMQMLALDGPARAWEPKRLRLLSAARRIVRGGRRLRVRIAATLALGHPDHHRDHPPASPRARLTSAKPPLRPGRTTEGQWNPAHPARQPGSQPRPDAENSKRPPSQLDSSKSRNIEASLVKESILGGHYSFGLFLTYRQPSDVSDTLITFGHWTDACLDASYDGPVNGGPAIADTRPSAKKPNEVV